MPVKYRFPGKHDWFYWPNYGLEGNGIGMMVATVTASYLPEWGDITGLIFMYKHTYGVVL